MDQKIMHAAETTETAGVTTLMLTLISAGMGWLNENHLAVIALVTIITGIVTVLSAVFRYILNKRKVDLYEQEVKNKIRRKQD